MKIKTGHAQSQVCLSLLEVQPTPAPESRRPCDATLPYTMYTNHQVLTFVYIHVYFFGNNYTTIERTLYFDLFVLLSVVLCHQQKDVYRCMFKKY